MRTTSLDVLIASNISILCDGMAAALSTIPTVRVVARAHSVDEAVELSKVHRPNIAVLDFGIEWGALCDLVRQVAGFKVAPLLMTDPLDSAQTFELLQHGANGVVCRTTHAELFRRCINAVGAGEIWIRRETVSYLVDRSRADFRRAPREKESDRQPNAAGSHANRYELTLREKEIVRAVGGAMTNKDIAGQFGISECTVKHHLTRIYDKMGVGNRLELAMFATHHGLIGESVN